MCDELPAWLVTCSHQHGFDTNSAREERLSMTSLTDYLNQHPLDRERVDAHKERMLAEVRAYKLRELREAA